MNHSRFQFPKWTQRLLRSICPEHLLEEIEGDLLQRFSRDIKLHGEKKARRRLIWNTIRFFRPGIVMRKKFSVESNHLHMLRNYFTIMFRNFARRKFYSSVNVLCLTVGIAFALLIGAFIKGELQVNQDLKDVDRLYLLQSKFKTDRGNFEWFAPGLLTKYAAINTLLRSKGTIAFLTETLRSPGTTHISEFKV